MRISDWSSDVCSSDLDRLEQRLHHFLDRKLDEVGLIEREGDLEARGEGFRAFGDRVLDDLRGRLRVRAGGERHREARAGMPVDAAQHIIALRAQQIGRASCRERVWQYG